jgi:hypothetical protein
MDEQSMDEASLADYMPREEDWGSVLPARPSNAKLRMAARQASWLQAYAMAGTITGASKASGISRDQYYYWQARDTYGFNRRLQIAQAAWVDHLESIAYARIMAPSHNGRIGSDGLLSHALNAHSPRWRGPQPAGQAEVGEVMKAILSLARSAPKVVEGGSSEALPLLDGEPVAEG